MLAKEHIDDLLNRNGDVLSTDGDKIGSVGQVYADDDDGQPTWVTVKTRAFRHFRVLRPARRRPSSKVMTSSSRTPRTRSRTRPGWTPTATWSPPRRTAFTTTTGSGVPAGPTPTRPPAGMETMTGQRPAAGSLLHGGFNAADANDTVGRDTSGPTTDDAMTRSEERLNVGTEKQATGRARLRKYVTTENVTRTVPVQREEVRIEREPITEANRGAALSGPDLSDEEHEVTLHEERPVIEKETVPVERVRLDTETVTDEVTVDEEVRKERIETDGVDDTRR